MPTPVEDIGKVIKKAAKPGPMGSPVATHSKLVGGVLPTAGGGAGGPMVMASVVPSLSKSQVMTAARSVKGGLHVTVPPQPREQCTVMEL